MADPLKKIPAYEVERRVTTGRTIKVRRDGDRTDILPCILAWESFGGR